MLQTGDKVVPLIGNFKYLTGTVVEIEDRANGCITVEFTNGERGLYFKSELAKQ